MEYDFVDLPSGFAMDVSVENTRIMLEIVKLSDSRDSLAGIMTVSLLQPKETRLYVGKFNVLSSRTRSSLASHLAKVSPKSVDFSKDDWLALIEKFCQLVIERFYTPKPPVRIEPLENTEIDFLLYPFLPQGHPVLLYAPGGSGKSLLAMWITLLVQNGIPLPEQEQVKKTNALYVDWEVDLQEARRRYTRIARGIDKENLEFPMYKRASLPLKDELDDILLWVAKNDIGLVVLDSAGPALGGDINNAEKVIELFSGIRKITSTGATVLLLTHVSKSEKSELERSPLGSVYFENLSRLTWELKFDYVEDGIMDFALFPRKSNFGQFDSLGFRVAFKFDMIVFEPIPAENVSTGGVKPLILSVLEKSPQGLTVAELAKYLGISKQKIFVHLSQLKKQKKVDNDSEGRWKIIRDEVIDW